MSKVPDTPTAETAVKRLFDRAKGWSAQALFHSSILMTLAYAYSTGSIDSNFFQVFGLGVGVNLLSDVIGRLARGEKAGGEDLGEALQEALANSNLNAVLTNEEFRRNMAWLFARHEGLMVQLISSSEQNVVESLLTQIEQHQMVTAKGLYAIYKRLEEMDVKGDERHLEILAVLRRLVPAVPIVPLQRPERAEYFTDREQELEDLLAHLRPGTVFTLCGPGGIGKSALAAEAIWALGPRGDRADRFPDGVISHNFYNQPEAELALEHITLSLGEEVRPSAEAAARRALAGKQLLLLLDGAEVATELARVLAVRDQCGVLVTSRKRSDARAERLDMLPLELDDAVQLLLAWSGDEASAAVEEICTFVGRLPLAVRLVGRYLNETGETAEAYLDWLRQTPLEALAHEERRDKSVPYLLECSLAQVSEAARQVVAVVGLLALAPFAWEMVEVAIDMGEHKVRQALGELVNYGLLVKEGGDYAVTHALIHTYAREAMPAGEDELARLVAGYVQKAKAAEEMRGQGYADLDRVRRT